MVSEPKNWTDQKNAKCIPVYHGYPQQTGTAKWPVESRGKQSPSLAEQGCTNPNQGGAVFDRDLKIL